MRHRIDAGISFFPSRRIPMQPDFFHLSQIGMSRGESGLESSQCNWGFTDFYMEMSTGGSELRTAQYFVYG